MGYNLDEIDSDHLTDAWLYRKVDSLALFRYYCGDFRLGVRFRSPLRTDNDPSFGIIFWSGHNIYGYKDFANGDAGSVVKLVSKLYGLSKSDAIVKIATDFGLINNAPKLTDIQIQKLMKDSSSMLSSSSMRQAVGFYKFTQEELDYWGGYLITEEELKRERIYALKSLWIDKKQVYSNEKRKDLAFCFFYPEYKGFKLYQPRSVSYKWYMTIGNTDIDGLQVLPKRSRTVLITKGKKDKIELLKIHDDVCSTQNESYLAISEENHKFFEENYDNKIIVWDSDETGKRESKKLNSRGYSWLNVPNKYLEEDIKDFSDLVLKYKERGLEILKEELAKKIG